MRLRPSDCKLQLASVLVGPDVIASTGLSSSRGENAAMEIGMVMGWQRARVMCLGGNV